MAAMTPLWVIDPRRGELTLLYWLPQVNWSHPSQGNLSNSGQHPNAHAQVGFCLTLARMLPTALSHRIAAVAVPAFFCRNPFTKCYHGKGLSYARRSPRKAGVARPALVTEGIVVSNWA